MVSIVIVNWNGKRWIEKCLHSLIYQTYKNTEIIFVDNASTDGSVEYVLNKFKNVHVIACKKNTGFSTANNLGVKIAKGRYLLLINLDAWIEKDFLEDIFNFYTANSYDVISPTEKRYDKSIVKILNTTIDIAGMPAYYRYGKRNPNPFYLSTCYFLSKEVYLSSRGFDNGHFLYMEDVDWFWRLKLLKKSYVYVPHVYIYHAGGGSITSGFSYNTFLWRNQNTLQTLLKNYSFFTLIIILPIYFIQNILEIIFFMSILKPKLAWSYLQSWIFNIKNIKTIMNKRRWIQKRRQVSDIEIFKAMYHGSGKYLHFRRVYL